MRRDNIWGGFKFHIAIHSVRKVRVNSTLYSVHPENLINFSAKHFYSIINSTRITGYLQLCHNVAKSIIIPARVEEVTSNEAGAAAKDLIYD